MMLKKENTPTLETKRLLLRRFTDADLQDMFCIYSDPDVNTFLPWFPFETIEETKTYLHSNIYADYEKEIAYRYAIELKNTKQVVGYLSLTGIDAEKACGDLGYGLRQEFWGQGIIPEAASELLTLLKKNGFQYITATHDVNNPKSGRVMEKIGMTYQSSYDEQWQPKNFKVTFKLYRIDL